MVKFTILLAAKLSATSFLKYNKLPKFRAKSLFFMWRDLKTRNLELWKEIVDGRQLFLCTFQLLSGKKMTILLSLGNMLFLLRLNFLIGYQLARVLQKISTAFSCRLNTCLLLKLKACHSSIYLRDHFRKRLFITQFLGMSVLLLYSESKRDSLLLKLKRLWLLRWVDS